MVIIHFVKNLAGSRKLNLFLQHYNILKCLMFLISDMLLTTYLENYFIHITNLSPQHAFAMAYMVSTRLDFE